jgi:hypothetical protein
VLQPNFDLAPKEVRINRCGYVSQCKARGCPKRATLIAEKVDTAGRHVRQVQLYARHCDIVIERERARGLEICDRRDEQRLLSSIFVSKRKQLGEFLFQQEYLCEFLDAESTVFSSTLIHQALTDEVRPLWQ